MGAASFTANKIRVLEPAQVMNGLAGEAMTLGQVVRRNTSEQWVKARANTVANCTGLLGLVLAGSKADDGGDVVSGEKIDVLVFGRVAGFASLDETKDYYLSDDTAGGIEDAITATVYRFVGSPDTEEVFFWNPAQVPTSA